MFNLFRKLVPILILTTLSFLYACEEDAVKKLGYKNNQKITLTGRIGLVGNTPFTQLVLNHDNKQLYLKFKDTKEKQRAFRYQSQDATVSGTISVQKQVTADKKYTRYKLILTVDSITFPRTKKTP